MNVVWCVQSLYWGYARKPQSFQFLAALRLPLLLPAWLDKSENVRSLLIKPTQDAARGVSELRGIWRLRRLLLIDCVETTGWGGGGVGVRAFLCQWSTISPSLIHPVHLCWAGANPDFRVHPSLIPFHLREPPPRQAPSPRGRVPYRAGRQVPKVQLVIASLPGRTKPMIKAPLSILWSLVSDRQLI